MSDTDILGRRPRLRDGLVAEHTGHGSPFISNSDKRAARFTATASQERLKEAAVVVCGAGGLGGCHSGVDMHHGRVVPAMAWCRVAAAAAGGVGGGGCVGGGNPSADLRRFRD